MTVAGPNLSLARVTNRAVAVDRSARATEILRNGMFPRSSLSTGTEACNLQIVWRRPCVRPARSRAWGSIREKRNCPRRSAMQLDAAIRPTRGPPPTPSSAPRSLMSVADLVPCVKPQAAFFEQLGPAGMISLGEVIRIRSSGRTDGDHRRQTK